MNCNRLRDVMTLLALGLVVGACATDDSGPAPVDTVETQGVQRLTLNSFGYWGGSFEWTATRDALTAAQAEALAALKVIPAKEGCAQDIQEYALVLVDAAGQERRLVTNEYNTSCSGGEVLDYESLKPLLATLTCLGTRAGAMPLAEAPTLQAGDGCKHGFFAYKDDPPRWVKVLPQGPGGPHTFELLSCGGKTTALELFDASGTELLAQAQADGTPSGECAKLTHSLETGHTYALRVTSQAVTTGGHVNLVVRRD